MILHLKILHNMEVIVKSSPKIEIELATKVVKAGGGDVKADGVYPDLTAGDLAGRGESVPAEFGFRASGGKSIKDGRAYIKRIKGNSVVWNQLINGIFRPSGNTTITNDGDVWTITPDGENTYPGIKQENFIVPKGHKYLVAYETLFEGTLSAGINICGQSAEINLTSGGSWISDQRIIEYTTGNNNTIIFFFKNAKSEIKVRNFIVIDLTKMFQAGNEPTTIEDFNARVATLGVDMNAYNEGEVIHCNAESIKSVGDNAWDEEWEVGNISGSTGTNVNSDSLLRSKNLIPIIPTERYYATILFGQGVFFYDDKKQFIKRRYNLESIPQNARYMRFVAPAAYGTTYKNDIMITLKHSGWKYDTDAGYQPYWQDTLPLPIISKYFPQGMKKAGTAHDEIRYNKASGKWEAVEAIGTRAYQEGDADNATYLTDWKVTCYPLAEPIVTELDAEDQNFRDYYNVADFGTEQSQSSVPSAPFSADIIYQFNAVDQIRENYNEIEKIKAALAKAGITI